MCACHLFTNRFSKSWLGIGTLCASSSRLGCAVSSNYHAANGRAHVEFLSNLWLITVVGVEHDPLDLVKPALGASAECPRLKCVWLCVCGLVCLYVPGHRRGCQSYEGRVLWPGGRHECRVGDHKAASLCHSDQQRWLPAFVVASVSVWQHRPSHYYVSTGTTCAPIASVCVVQPGGAQL